MLEEQFLLRTKGISKRFSSNIVLQGIDLDIKPGEVHALLGENGAGKSTLIKILNGSHTKDQGEVFWEGKKVKINTPEDAMRLGIATIYQELNLFPNLSVFENIFIGREITSGSHLLDRKAMKNRAKDFMEQLGQKSDIINKKVKELGIGKQQLVAIAKSLTLNAKLIIMDEPTSSLSGSEVEQLYKTIFALKKKGVAIVFISHRLEEVKKVGDRITILRDGYVVDTLQVNTTSIDKMIELMVGRSLNEKFPKQQIKKGGEGFSVNNLRLKGSKHKVSFNARHGEVLGFSGLVGSGRTELMKGIFGADSIEEGEIKVFGEVVKISNPKDAIDAGLVYITEDRKGEGLILDQSVFLNIALANLKKFKRNYLLNIKGIKKEAQRFVEELKIRPDDIDLAAKKLSGGNQQKVVIAKWLNTNAKIFILDEPTRGIDVGAKVEVYRLINLLIDSGKIVIMVSSELSELLGMCDRILVMKEGEITDNMERFEADQERIMKAATGG